MILFVSILTLLVATSTEAQRIKGGRRIYQEPAIQEPHIHVGKGGGGGALHHTAVVQDPQTGAPVVVDKVSRIGSGGIKSAGLGAGSSQFALSDGPFGQRRLYRVGQSQYPFGLLGSDYYSYPNSLLTAPRNLRRKTVVSDNLSGLRPVGFGGRSGGIIVADPSTSQFSVGDSQIKTSVFGARRPIYRSGISSVPYGLMGLDYYSYPNQLLSQRRFSDGLGLGQTRILTGGSAFSAGDSQIRGPLIDNVGQEKVTIVETDPLGGGQRVTTVQNAGSSLGSFGGPAVKTTQQVIPQQVSVVDDGFGQRQVIKTTGGGLGGGYGGLRGGQIVLSGARGGIGGLRRVKSRPVISTIESSGLGAPIGGFGQRQVAITKSAPAPIQVLQAPAPVRIVQAQAPVRVVQRPAPVQFVQAPAPVQVVQAPVQRRVITQRPGDVFLSQISRPRVATFSRPSQISVPVQSAGLGNIQFTLGGNQLIGGPIVSQAPAISAAPRQVFAQAPRQVFAQAPRQVFAQAPRQVFAAAPRQIITAARPQVLSQVKTDVGLRRNFFGNRSPQLVYLDGGRRFAGIDIIGGSRIGDPRFGYTQLPISTSRFANLGLNQASIEAGPTLLSPASQVIGVRKGGSLLSSVGKTSPSKVVTQEEVIGPAGDRQVVTTVTKSGPQSFGSPSKIGGSFASGPLGLQAVGHTSPTKVVTQEEVIGPAGDPQVITTITETDSNSLVPSKIGGLASGGGLGFQGIGRSGPTQVVTQEEVVGPAGDPQVITTVTQTDSAGPSKIGGLASGGFAGIGRTSPSKVVTQEEVVGPLGDRQVVTTVTESDSNRLVGSKIGGLSSGGLAGIGQGPATIVQQDPIETAIQESLGDGGFGQSVQSLVDPLSGGQVSIDDGLGGGVTQVKETLVREPFTGEVTKVTEVTQSGGSGGGLQQQNIADAIVQESISSGLGGSGGYGYLPRVSFLSQYPYDAPDTGLLRSVITRPVVQQQQEVGQFLV